MLLCVAGDDGKLLSDQSVPNFANPSFLSWESSIAVPIIMEMSDFSIRPTHNTIPRSTRTCCSDHCAYLAIVNPQIQMFLQLQISVGEAQKPDPYIKVAATG